MEAREMTAGRSLSGEVERGGAPSTAPAIGQTAVVYQGDRERFVGKIVAKGEGQWRGHWAVQSPRGLREWVGADQLACVTAR